MVCRICGNAPNNIHHKLYEMMYGTRDEFIYLECDACGTLQIRDFPDDVSKFYPNGYYSYVQTKNNIIVRALPYLRDQYGLSGKGLIGRILWQIRPNDRIAIIKNILLEKSNLSKILDVGCGAGTFLRSLVDLGFRNVLGIDPYVPHDILYKNRLLVKKGFMEGLEGNFDLIMFNHSLEHMRYPACVMRSTYSRLAHDGYCVVAVPLCSSYVWQHYGVYWVQLDAPRHMYIFSEKGMRIVMEGVGFDVIEVIYDSTAFQFWGSEQYMRGISLVDKNSYAVNKKRALFSKRDISLFEVQAANLNKHQLGDQATFIMRKK